jgi:hypothetical protein
MATTARLSELAVQAIAIGFDFEVKENEFERGPGWARGKAQICGGSIDLLFPDGSTYTEYRPIRHEVDRHLNLPVDSTVRYWRDLLQSKIPKFGANLIYDVGNATDENIWVQGELYDCQFAEAIAHTRRTCKTRSLPIEVSRTTQRNKPTLRMVLQSLWRRAYGFAALQHLSV